MLDINFYLDGRQKMNKTEIDDLYAFIHDYIDQNSMQVMEVVGVLELIKMEIITDAYNSLTEDSDE